MRPLFAGPWNRLGTRLHAGAAFPRPLQEQASLLMDEHSCITLGTHRLESDDVVWLRQSDSPMDALPGAKAASPSSAFFEALICMLENLPVRCVNRYSASRLVRNKAVQLRMAQRFRLKDSRNAHVEFAGGRAALF